jgi:hypothetical protein
MSSGSSWLGVKGGAGEAVTRDLSANPMLVLPPSAAFLGPARRRLQEAVPHINAGAERGKLNKPERFEYLAW